MPSLRAFWRNDPSVRFVIFTSLATDVFAFECARSSFTSSFVYSRRTILFLVFLATDVSRTVSRSSSTSNVLGNLPAHRAHHFDREWRVQPPGSIRPGQFVPCSCSVHFSWGSQMSSLRRRIAAITHTAAKLIAQVGELDRVRERARKAQLLVRTARGANHRKQHAALF
jgi:hypothetical protein